MTVILVTGGAGFIGSHVCKALARHGFTPVVYDNLKQGYASAVQWGPLVEGDILDTKALKAAMEAHKPAAVMHFAALIAVGESVADPLTYYQNNVAGSLSLIEAMRAHALNKIVFSSTAAVYGITDNAPITEDTPKSPINPYGATKLMIEQALLDCGAAYGLKSAILRYFNAAGADPDGQIGEDHQPETHAIPLAVQAALGFRESFSLFGDDYPTPDGSAVRDFVHVADLAEAHVLALKHLLAGGDSLAVNLGVGRGISVLEIVKAVEQATGKQVPLKRAPRRAGDPAVLVAASDRARTLLNWTPQYTNAADIVGDAARWIAKRGW